MVGSWFFLLMFFLYLLFQESDKFFPMLYYFSFTKIFEFMLLFYTKTIIKYFS